MSDDAPLHILWRDDHLVAVHKPAGWLVHRTGLDAHETRFVLQTLRDQLGRHVYPVHRLDKGTSGVLLMALSPEVARMLAMAFEAHQVDKRYVAMVRGWVPPHILVDHPLKPDDAPEDAPAQPAQTAFQRLATLQLPIPVDRYPSTRVSLVEARPATGRRHQIRRHLKHLAHPIVGDSSHGKGAHNRWWAGYVGLQRLWLHAASLSLVHPVTGQRLLMTSDCFGSGPAGTASALNADWGELLSKQPWQWEPGVVPGLLQP